MSDPQRAITVLLLVMVVILVQTCRPPESGRETEDEFDFPVAVIDGKMTIMYTDLYSRIAASDMLKEGGILDSTTYFDTLIAIVVDSLVSLDALHADLREDLTLYREYSIRFYDFYTKYLFQRLILDSVEVDSAVVDSYFHAHEDRYYYEEQVRAKQLTIAPRGFRFGEDSAEYKDYSDEQLDSVARERIIELKKRSDAGEDFGVLAYEFSMNRATGDRGGDLGYFLRNTFNEVVDSVAFSLPPGTVSEPFRSPDGWHLLYVMDHVDSGLATLEGEVYQLVQNDFIRETAMKRSGYFIDSLMNIANYVYNDSALMLQAHTVPDTVWSVIVNEVDTVDFHRLPDVFARHMTRLGKSSLSLQEKHDALMDWTQKYLIARAGDLLGFD
ncbi:MAG: peptidylprolyl isomerase, partial [Candidatus Zixiibacteriota bacterium]